MIATRREVIGLLSGAAAWPITTLAQQSPPAPRLCVLAPDSPSSPWGARYAGDSRLIRLVPSHEGCRLPLTKGSSRQADWPKSTAMTYPLRSTTITAASSLVRGSPPLSGASVLSASRVGAACAFSLGIAGQVLPFHTGAWSSFAPPTRRMPLRRYQDILRADPGGWVSPRFRWFGISDLIAEPEGPSFISSTVAQHRVDRRYS